MDDYQAPNGSVFADVPPGEQVDATLYTLEQIADGILSGMLECEGGLVWRVGLPEDEVWINGFEHMYSVKRDGRVFSWKWGRVRELVPDRQGRVALYRGEKRHRRTVDSIVSLHWR